MLGVLGCAAEGGVKDDAASRRRPSWLGPDGLVHKSAVAAATSVFEYSMFAACGYMIASGQELFEYAEPVTCLGCLAEE